MERPKRLLVTGATGFLGNHICRFANAHDYQIIPGIRKTSIYKLQGDFYQAPLFIDLLDSSEFKADLATYESANGPIDYVIHCAGITRTKQLKNFKLGNVDFTTNIVNAFTQKANPCKKFIYISSLAAGGPGDPISMKGIHESDPSNPISPYGKSKLGAEQVIEKMNNSPWLIFRPTAIYGPGDHNFPKFYRLFKKGIDVRIGDKERKMSFIHVHDLAALLVLALDSKQAHKYYGVSDGRSYTQDEFHHYIKQSFQSKAIKIQIPMAVASGIGHLNQFIAKLKGEAAHMNAIKFKDLCSKNYFLFQAKYTLDKVDFSKL
jgi:nucleoside-diphosphate-sugar epimerase